MAFSAVVLFIVLFSTFDENTLTYLGKINLSFLVLAIIMRFFSCGIWALRIKEMALSLGHRVPYPHCLNMVFANLLMGAITPGQAGGEPVRIHELYRAQVPVGDATAVVITERVFDAFVLVILGIISIIVMREMVYDLSIEILFAMGLALTLMIFFVIFIIFTAMKPEPTKRVVTRFLHWLYQKTKMHSVHQLISKSDQEIENFCNGVCMYAGHGRKGLFTGLFCTAGFWISEFMVASVIMMGLGLPPCIPESFLFQLIIATVSMIPLTPGASGIAELSATTLYALIIPSSILGIFILLWRVIMFYLNIVLGIVSSLIIFKREINPIEEIRSDALANELID